MAIRSLQTLTVTPTELRNAVTFPTVMSKVVDHLAAHTQALRTLEDRLTLLTQHVSNDIEVPVKKQLQEMSVVLPQFASIESVNSFAEEIRGEFFETSSSFSDRLSKHERLFPRVQELEKSMEEEKLYVHETIYGHLRKCEIEVKKHSDILSQMGAGKDTLDKVMSKHAADLKKISDLMRNAEERHMEEVAELHAQIFELKGMIDSNHKELTNREDELEVAIKVSEKTLIERMDTVGLSMDQKVTRKEMNGSLSLIQKQLDGWRADIADLENQLLKESQEMKSELEKKSKEIMGEVQSTRTNLHSTIEADRVATVKMQTRIDSELNNFDERMKDLRDNVSQEVRAEGLKRRKLVVGVEAALIQRIKAQPEKILKRARVQVMELTKGVLEEHRATIEYQLKGKLDTALLEPLLSTKVDISRLSAIPDKNEIRQFVVTAVQEYVVAGRRATESMDMLSVDRGLTMKELQNAGVKFGGRPGEADTDDHDDDFDESEHDEKRAKRSVSGDIDGGKLASKVDKWAARLLLVNHDVLRIGSLVAELHSSVASLREEKENSQCILTRSGNRVRCQNCNTYIVTEHDAAATSLQDHWPFVDDNSQHGQYRQLPPSAPGRVGEQGPRNEMQRRKLVSSESKRGVLAGRFGGKIPNDFGSRAAPSPREGSNIIPTGSDMLVPMGGGHTTEREMVNLNGMTVRPNTGILPSSIPGASPTSIFPQPPPSQPIGTGRTPKIWFN